MEEEDLILLPPGDLEEESVDFRTERFSKEMREKRMLRSLLKPVKKPKP